MILVKLLFDTPEYISDVDHYGDDGTFYSGDLVNLPSLQDRMLSESYGIAADKTVSVEISNRDNYWSNLVQSSEIRGRSVSVLRKDSDGASFSYFGTITKYSISKTVILTLSSMDSQIFNKKIPAETTTTELFTENGLESGVPINVCFGICINVPLCTINNDIVEDKYDYLIGYGPIEGIYTDSDQYGVKRNGHLVNSEEYLFYDGSQSTPYPGFAFLRFGTEQRDFTGNFYTLSADIKGLTMGGASAERNFINVIGHVLSNSTWGLGQSIDSTSFGSEATYLSTKLYCDGVVSSETDSGDLLNTLLTLSRSVLSRTESGAIGIYTEKPKTSILTLGSNDGYYNNAQTNEIYSLDSNQLFKKITVNYGHRPDEEYEDSKTAYTENEIYLDCYENFGKEEKISLEFVEDHGTAKDILSFMRNKNLYGGKFVSAKVSLEGKGLNRGDMITYIDPKYQIDADYLVSAISKNLKDQYTLTLRKYDSRFYSVETIDDPVAPVTATTIKMNSFIGDISLGDGELQSGRIRLLRAPGFGDVYLISGKTDFTQLTQDGFVIGIDDSDGLSKFFFSNNQDPDHPALIGFDGEKPIILSDNFSINDVGEVRIGGSTPEEMESALLAQAAEYTEGWSTQGATTNNVYFQVSAPDGSSGDIWLDTDDNQLYTHDGTQWVPGKSGTDGADGVDGESISWQGSLASAPSSPSELWAYYNTSDGKSYVYSGGNWYQMSADGEAGADGIPITWKGSSSSPPASPQLNWAYYDTDNGIAYIYNGSGWEVLAQDGLDGLNGLNGSDGASTFTYYQTSTPTTPSINELWFNSSTRLLKRWSGYSWDLVGNSYDNTSHLTDGALLGYKANWSYVTGTGKPADYATRNTGALADKDTVGNSEITSISGGKVTTGKIQSLSGSYFDLDGADIFLSSAGKLMTGSTATYLGGVSAGIWMAAGNYGVVCSSITGVKLQSSSYYLNFTGTELSPSTATAINIGSSSKKFNWVYCTAISINGTLHYSDIIDDLDALHAIRPDEDGAIIANTLPRFCTTFDEAKKTIKRDCGDTITDAEVERSLSDPDDLAHMVGINIGQFVALIEGSVRQLDRENSAIQYELLDWIQSLEERVKDLTSTAIDLQSKITDLKTYNERLTLLEDRMVSAGI